MSFVPLHIHSGYSFLKSGLTIDKIIKSLKKSLYFGAGLSDINSLMGISPFVEAMEKEGIKPLVGMDIYVEDNLISLFVKNEIGYLNLLKIKNAINDNALTLEMLANTKEGIIAVISSYQSNLVGKLLEMKEDKFAHYMLPISNIGEEFYIGLEIYNNETKEDADRLRDFFGPRSYNFVAFPLIKYQSEKDAIALKIVTAIAEEEKLTEKEESGPYHFITDDEAKKIYRSVEVENTLKILDSTNFKFVIKRGRLLKYPLPLNKTAKETLEELAKEGLIKKVGPFNEEYEARLKYELSVIDQMGYNDYFLIVYDYVNYAKKNGITVGAGRGSAGGSLVAFALNITTVDPIKYGLLFERFLNKERQSMPDIDMDFEDIRREEVCEYLRNKYGTERVAHIATTQTIGAKQALRDIGRVYSFPDRDIDLLSKAIPFKIDSLREAYKKGKSFKEIVDSDKYYLNIVSLASKIEGLPRQMGMHAAGMIFNNERLDTVLPLSKDIEGNYISEIEKDYLESQGFLKVDILGLRNLTIIKNTLSQVENAPYYEDIPYEDEEAIKLIASGETMGVFQLESAGMKRTIKYVKPKTFEDVYAILALFRPGPMDEVIEFAKRKEGKTKVVYPDIKLKPILESTYGIMLYQEQIMQIARELAGFSYAEADLFRRAISKKDAAKLAKLKQSFVDGCIKNGTSEYTANQVFNLIDKFANYGFNKSHAVAYGKIATQMAYLKVHYGPAFYASILDNAGGATDAKFGDIISEMRKHHIQIKGPNINLSKNNYYVKDNVLIFPFSTIKGLLSTVGSAIVTEREKNGEFIDFLDFITRMTTYKLGAPMINKLIDAGAFDTLCKSRATLRNYLGKAMEYASLICREDGQMLLDTSIIDKPSMIEVEDDQLVNLNLEFELLGISLNGTPIDFYADQLKNKNAIKINDVFAMKQCATCGIIKSVKRIKTKKGDTMAFIKIYDETGELNVTIFASLYEKCFESLKAGNILTISGKYDLEREEFTANEIEEVNR